MDINKAIQTVGGSKQCYDEYVNKLYVVANDVEKYQVAYVLFIGSFYHDKPKGNTYLNLIQQLAGKVKHFQPHWSIFNSMMIQAHYYVRQAKGEQVPIHKEKNSADPKWKPLNPFMLPYKDSMVMFLVGMRITNFDKKGTHYFAAHGGKIQNYYETHLGSFANLKENKKVVFDFLDKTQYKKYSYDWNIVDGFEDYRTVGVWNEAKNDFDYYAFVVSVDTHYEGCPRQSIVKLNFNEKNKLLTLTDLQPLRASTLTNKTSKHKNKNKVIQSKNENKIVDNKECQKNWLPFVGGVNSDYKGKLLALYSTEPLQIIQVDPQTGFCEDVYTSVEKDPFYGETFSFRGSSPPIEWKQNYYLYAVHIVGYLPNNEGRVYYHRLVEMYHAKKEFRIHRISNMFYLNQPHTVEYISGSFHNITTQQVIFSYGLDDKKAMLCALHYNEIESLFST